MKTDLGSELYRYMVDHLYDTPREERGHWVMNGEWYAECRAMTDATGRPIWEPVARDETIFGLPVVIADGGGVPHLVADGPPATSGTATA